MTPGGQLVDISYPIFLLVSFAANLTRWRFRASCVDV